MSQQHTILVSIFALPQFFKGNKKSLIKINCGNLQRKNSFHSFALDLKNVDGSKRKNIGEGPRTV
jgi:hypothetical protein